MRSEGERPTARCSEDSGAGKGRSGRRDFGKDRGQRSRFAPLGPADTKDSVGVRLKGVVPRRAFVPDPFFSRAMELMPDALNAVMPLRSAHHADLPDAVRELSAQLTAERSALSRPYWTSPRLVSAYLRYFLPWNLLRLHRLFRALPLAAPEGSRTVLLDVGSGPLSVPLGLWLSRPEWRAASVQLICTDTAPHPMALGEALFRQLTRMCGEPLRWEIRLERRPILRALSLASLSPQLVTGGNVLNEWQDRSEDADDTLADRLSEVTGAIARLLPPGGMALFVEPGTRLGGMLTANLRTTALEDGLVPVAPCPHAEPCPLLGRRDRGWCHVHEELAGEMAVPAWLAGLASAARLAKQALSYAYMLIQQPRTPERNDGAFPDGLVLGKEKAGEDRAGGMPVGLKGNTASQHAVNDLGMPGVARELNARLLSDAFLVPELGQARYACSELGLLLVAHAVRFGAGGLIRCRLPSHPRRDAKSGALIAEPV